MEKNRDLTFFGERPRQAAGNYQGAHGGEREAEEEAGEGLARAIGERVNFTPCVTHSGTLDVKRMAAIFHCWQRTLAATKLGAKVRR